ncbi:hypothetical protein [uncultured Microscilla sp.]|uniref:hypothetical protein n=1 Tax=uncultured Microscilla sp. TaxID=432653 RepID=UPI00261C772A|nr:hypothetical protein [uncultured Microscilla sp.]
MDIEEYIFDWMDISDKLKDNSNTLLLNWSLNTTVYSVEEIGRKENELNLTLPTVLKQFYSLTDGFQLRWIHRNHPQFKDEEYTFDYSVSPLDLFSDDFSYSGCVNILPFDMVFNTDWNEVWSGWRENSSYSKKISVNGKKMAQGELFSKLYPFDFYGNGSTAAFYIDEQDFGVMLSTQYFLDFDSYPMIDFEAYLQMIQSDYGLYRKRAFCFDKLRYNDHLTKEINTLDIEMYDSISQFEFLS